jgi:hypothetical protein
MNYQEIKRISHFKYFYLCCELNIYLKVFFTKCFINNSIHFIQNKYIVIFPSTKVISLKITLQKAVF